MTRKPNGLTRRRLVQTGAVSLFPMPALAQAPAIVQDPAGDQRIDCVEQGADTEVLKVERAAGYIDGKSGNI